MSQSIQSDLELFIEETRELLRDMQIACADPNIDENYKQVYEFIERAIHTIQGNSLAFDFVPFHRVARNVLQTIRMSAARPDFNGLAKEELSLVLEFIMRSREYLSQVQRSDAPSPDFFQEIVQRVETFNSESLEGTPPGPTTLVPEDFNDEYSWKEEVEEILMSAPKVDPQLQQLAQMAADELERESLEASRAASTASSPTSKETSASEPSAAAGTNPMDRIFPEPSVQDAPVDETPSQEEFTPDSKPMIWDILDASGKELSMEDLPVPDRLKGEEIEIEELAIDLPGPDEPLEASSDAKAFEWTAPDSTEVDASESEMLAIEMFDSDEAIEETMPPLYEAEISGWEFPADESLELESGEPESYEPGNSTEQLMEKEINLEENLKDKQSGEEPEMETEIPEQTVSLEAIPEESEIQVSRFETGSPENRSKPAPSAVYGYAFEAWCLTETARKLSDRFQSTDWELGWGIPRITELLANFSRWGVESREVPLGEYLMNTAKWAEEWGRSYGDGLVINVTGEDVHVMPQLGEYICQTLQEIITVALPGAKDSGVTATALLFDFGSQADTGRIFLRIEGLPALTRTTTDLKFFEIQQRFGGIGGHIAKGKQPNEIVMELPGSLNCIEVLVARTGDRGALGIPWHRIQEVMEQAPALEEEPGRGTVVPWKGRTLEVLDLRDVAGKESPREGGSLVILGDGAGSLAVLVEGLVKHKREVLVEPMPPSHSETMIFGACIIVEDGKRIPLLIPGRYSKED